MNSLNMEAIFEHVDAFIYIHLHVHVNVGNKQQRLLIGEQVWQEKELELSKVTKYLLFVLW